MLNILFGDATLIITLVVVIVMLLHIIFIISRYRKCPADKIMVIYGKVGVDSAGEPVCFKCIHGGAVFIWPFFQSYQFLDLAPIGINADLKNALSKQNIFINISSRLTVGISTETEVMKNAAQYLLGLKVLEIQELVTDIILGQLRLVVAVMEVEEIIFKQDNFFETICRNIENEIKKVGLRLINLNVLDVNDEYGYIDTLKKEAISKAIKS